MPTEQTRSTNWVADTAQESARAPQTTQVAEDGAAGGGMHANK